MRSVCEAQAEHDGSPTIIIDHDNILAAYSFLFAHQFMSNHDRFRCHFVSGSLRTTIWWLSALVAIYNTKNAYSGLLFRLTFRCSAGVNPRNIPGWMPVFRGICRWKKTSNKNCASCSRTFVPLCCLFLLFWFITMLFSRLTEFLYAWMQFTQMPESLRQPADWFLSVVSHSARNSVSLRATSAVRTHLVPDSSLRCQPRRV